MSKKVRFHAKVKGYYFPDFNGLFWHSNSFWLHEQKVKVVFNNGSRSLLIGGTKYGLTKLRKQAFPCEITLTDSYPF